MLLQKREENNIALAATANNAKIIDDALADDFPRIYPKDKKYYMIVVCSSVSAFRSELSTY